MHQHLERLRSKDVGQQLDRHQDVLERLARERGVDHRVLVGLARHRFIVEGVLDDTGGGQRGQSTMGEYRG